MCVDLIVIVFMCLIGSFDLLKGATNYDIQDVNYTRWLLFIFCLVRIRGVFEASLNYNLKLLRIRGCVCEYIGTTFTLKGPLYFTRGHIVW